MLRDITFRADAGQASKRLDAVIAEMFRTTTRSLAGLAFDSGAVSVCGRRASGSDRVSQGDEVHVTELFEKSDCRIFPDDAPVHAVFADDMFAAADKPAGQDCCPQRPRETGTLAGRIVRAFPEVAVAGPDPMMGGILHRIDNGTSGLVLAARTEKAFREVRRQFSAHTVRKTYFAVVEGKVKQPGGVSGYLAHTSPSRGKMRVVSAHGTARGEKPLFAETFYRPLSEDRFGTLLEITIYTGVTHQIRCQLAYAGFPICGDMLYGAKSAVVSYAGIPRHLLHSAAMEFIHPGTGKRIRISSEMTYRDGDFTKCPYK